MREYFVYILANKPRGTLYVGMTSDVERRLAEHRTTELHSFTRRYAVHRLVHVETFADIGEAKQRERRLKTWLRSWKIALIEAGNPEWLDLSAS